MSCPVVYGQFEELRHLEASLDCRIHKLQRLFDAGKASPYDVDLEGNTLLHLAVEEWFGHFNYFVETLPTALESLARYLNRLGELHIPLNWTNQGKWTFMNKLVLRCGYPDSSDMLANFATPLLDNGAEFANFVTTDKILEPPYGDSCRLIELASPVGFIDALEGSELSRAVLHQSERELVEALRKWPQSINMGNGLAQTPLHMAVKWPEGVRLLLKHGAFVDPRDHAGDTPLYYALGLHCPQTVGLLMKADCSLKLREDVLDVAIKFIHSRNVPGFVDASFLHQDVSIKTLDTTIASLAERRRDLQNRLTGLPVAVSINTTVLRDDRVLDEYAEYAECAEHAAQENIDHIPLRASSLLDTLYRRRYRTVYHITNLVVEVAEKLWENGFRDIDVPDDDGLTPLATWRGDGMFQEIELCSWLIQKGAELHRPQHRLDDNSPDPAIVPTELLNTTRILHHVAFKIGYQFGFQTTIPELKFNLATAEIREHKEQLQKLLSRLSRNARLLLATIFSDCSSDDCICACSSRGCLASTLMLGVLFKKGAFSIELDMRDCFARSIEYLMIFVGPQSSSWDWLAKEIIRFSTFHELELRHTCCWFPIIHGDVRLVKFEEEERVEIQDEDKEKIELLESLLLEFEEHRGTQDLIPFLRGYWAVRMDEVLEELNSGVDEEGLRGMGVVLEEDSKVNWEPEEDFPEYWGSEDDFDDDWGSENEM